MNRMGRVLAGYAIFFGIVLAVAVEDVTVQWNPALAGTLKATPIAELFSKYKAGHQSSSRTQAFYFRELMGRSNAVEFLCEKLKRSPGEIDTRERGEVRAKAAFLLGRMGEGAKLAVPLLIEAFESDDENSVQMRLTDAFAELGPVAAEAKAVLLEGLKFQNPRVARALFRIDPMSEETLNAVLDAVSDPSSTPELRWSVVNSLSICKVQSPRRSTFLSSLANEDGNPLQKQAVEQLQLLNWQTQRQPSPKTSLNSATDASVLLEKLEANPDDRPAAESLAKLGPEASTRAVAIILEAIKQKRVRYVLNSIGMFEVFGPAAKNALPLLMEYAAGDAVGPANNAMMVIGKIGPAAIEAKPILLNGLKDGTPILRWRAAFTLCLMDPERVDDYLPALLEALRHENDISDYGVRSIGDIGPAAAKATPTLMKFLNVESRRLSAGEALLKVRPDAETKVLVAGAISRDLVNESVHARDRAARMLGQIGKEARIALPELRKAAKSEDLEFAKIVKESIEKIESDQRGGI